MKKENENLRESKLTCNINLYKIKSAEMFAEFISNEEEEFYMICPKCGSEMPDDSAFCTRCGASLHTGTQENQNSQEDHSREIHRGRHTATEIHRETTERIMAIHR